MSPTTSHRVASVSAVAANQTRPSAVNQNLQTQRAIDDAVREIRVPLMGVRESIRQVYDSEIGPVNRDQQVALENALDDCEAIDLWIKQLSECEQSDSPTMVGRRRWITIDRLMQTLKQSLEHWTQSHGVSVQFDPMVAGTVRVFADPYCVSRLISSLVQNSTSASRSGQNILIRYTGGPPSDAVTWSVIDRGRGLTSEDLRQALQPGVSYSRGNGLSVCRDWAALHHSTLIIRTRLGAGTSVQFQVPCGGSASVAAAYARWRLAIRGPKTRPTRRDSVDDSTRGSIRFDSPVASSNSSRPKIELESNVEMPASGYRPMMSDRVMIGTMGIGAMVARPIVDEIARVLPGVIGRFDYLDQIDSHTFVYAIDEAKHRFADRTDQIDEKVLRRVPEARLQWSDPQDAPIDDHGWVMRFTDLAVRTMLAAERRQGSIAIIDEARLGADPIVDSSIATLRLDEEIRRLGTHMRSQNSTLRQQAGKLRR
jgi:Histidine kinase-, DNA gyrase B-, and HSP90-like ATPase